MVLTDKTKIKRPKFSAEQRRTVQAMVQANVITSAKNDLSRDQRRIVHHLLRQIYITNRWPEGGVLSIDFVEFSEIYGVSQQEARDDLRKAISDFKGKAINYSPKLDTENSWDAGEIPDIELDWTIKRESRHSSGRYRVTFNPELKDLLMPLVANQDGKSILFTYMDRNETKNLQLKYSVRLYEALCQFQSTGQFLVTPSELLARWCVPQSYSNYPDFKRHILNRSIDEIRRKTRFSDLSMVENKSEKGKVTRLLFQFTSLRLDEMLA